MIIGKFKVIAFGFIAFTISLSALASVYGQSESFYTGKTIRSHHCRLHSWRLLRSWGTSPGPVYAQTYQGSPEFIVQNMPGAGSIIAANHVYNVAKPDGLTVGMPNYGA